MTAVDLWARKDATRIHSRIVRLLRDGEGFERDEIDYLRRHALFVLGAPGDLPLGWASDLAELVQILDEMDQAREMAT